MELLEGLVVKVNLEGTPPDVMRKMITEQEVARTNDLDPAAGAKASGPDVEGELLA